MSENTEATETTEAPVPEEEKPRLDIHRIGWEIETEKKKGKLVRRIAWRALLTDGTIMPLTINEVQALDNHKATHAIDISANMIGHAAMALQAIAERAIPMAMPNQEKSPIVDPKTVLGR